MDERGVPLLLGATRNRRSFIAVQNLCDFLLKCVEHPMAASETFLISDGVDLSTTEFVRQIAAALNRPARLLPIPEQILRWPLRALKRERLLNQLFGSLVIDSQKARQLLKWQPPYISVSQTLATRREQAQPC